MSTVFSTEDILQAWTGLANTYLYIKPMYKFTQYMYMYVDYKESKSTHSVSRSITVRLYAEPDWIVPFNHGHWSSFMHI